MQRLPKYSRRATLLRQIFNTAIGVSAAGGLILLGGHALDVDKRGVTTAYKVLALVRYLCYLLVSGSIVIICQAEHLK